MYRESVSPFYTRFLADALVGALAARPAAALAAALEIHLWKDQTFNPTPDTEAAEFLAAQCDFTDYVAAAAVALTTPVNLNPGAVGAIGSAVFHITTSPVVIENTVYGYWLESGADVLMFEKFAEGQQVQMGSTGDFLELLAALPTQFNQDASAS